MHIFTCFLWARNTSKIPAKTPCECNIRVLNDGSFLKQYNYFDMKLYKSVRLLCYRKGKVRPTNYLGQHPNYSTVGILLA